MAALSNDEAMITAVEKNKIRADRLRFNLERQGALRVNVLEQDARKLDDFFSFDKVLLDAPCSGSGTSNLFSEKFTEELVCRSVTTQMELLKKASRVVKVGGEIVYSTCSILKRENEDIIQSILKSGDFEIVPINGFEDVPRLPALIERYYLY